ncbi:MAG: pyridoxine 5'-phosphate synthase [Gemmataceae bacterium]|jgi:pyridoxine 5-phosphate synthase|nr:pyridoxine 5'-phosphate synthase [Gemmataceae bacterium]
MIRLGVNIDHVATIRQARRTYEPDPVQAAGLAMLGGADGITIHLREDRRHIQDRDLRILRETVPFGLNLEMSCAEEIVALACQIKPDQVTLVPEKREELTTEGGLDVIAHQGMIADTIKRLQGVGISVALFIDPVPKQIEMSSKLRARAIEFHTGHYAEARTEINLQQQLEILKFGAEQAHQLGLHVHMGHGLNYLNVKPIVRLPHVEELNIGHAIISRAVLVGMVQAVKDMKMAMSEHFTSRIISH